MAREFEVKCSASPEQLEAIRRDIGGDFRKISMETTYYDTPDRKLSALHYTLRRRYENGVSVCTVKTPAKGLGRGEWETECPDIGHALPGLCELGAPEWLASLNPEELQPLCGAKFTRFAAVVKLEDGAVELALDQGILMGGTAVEALCEVEVELKSGTDEAALAYASALANRYHLTQETKSKFRRALALTEVK